MAFNGSYTAAMSPTIADSFPSSHMLSSSISSLSSSISSRHSASSTAKTYRQASTLFLTRRLPEALSTVLPLITPPSLEETNGLVEPAPVAKASRSTRIKVWSLYLTILNAIIELDPDEGKESFGAQDWRALCSKVREGEVWEEVVRNGYHGVEGDVDSDVVINLATLLLSHARTQTLNQQRLENYLAASTTPNLDLSDKFAASPSPRLSSRHRSPAKAQPGTSGANTPRDLNARVKILELYTLHVLLRNNEWDYAREFISVSSVLDDERREAFLQALQSLQEEQHEAERREHEERRRQEEELRRDVEDARRLRAENEERERKRVEEERARRNGSEVDYGIEQTPAPEVSGKGRHSRAPSSLAKPAGSGSGPRTSQARGRAVAPTSYGARAVMVLSNLRTLIQSMNASLQANPALLLRTIAFIAGLLLMLSRKSIREKVTRMMATGFNKIKATAGMGVKVTYI